MAANNNTVKAKEKEILIAKVNAVVTNAKSARDKSKQRQNALNFLDKLQNAIENERVLLPKIRSEMLENLAELKKRVAANDKHALLFIEKNLKPMCHCPITDEFIRNPVMIRIYDAEQEVMPKFYNGLMAMDEYQNIPHFRDKLINHEGYYAKIREGIANV